MERYDIKSLYSYKICQDSELVRQYRNDMISGSKGQKAVRACTIRLLNLGPAKHEEVAIYVVNQRIPNVLGLRELLCSEAIRDIMIYL